MEDDNDDWIAGLEEHVDDESEEEETVTGARGHSDATREGPQNGYNSFGWS